MTLFQKLQDIIPMGYKVSFHHFAFNLIVSVAREEIDGVIFSRDSWLPLADHFSEDRVVGCIDFMVTELQKTITEHRLKAL